MSVPSSGRGHTALTPTSCWRAPSPGAARGPQLRHWKEELPEGARPQARQSTAAPLPSSWASGSAQDCPGLKKASPEVPLLKDPPAFPPANTVRSHPSGCSPGLPSPRPPTCSRTPRIQLAAGLCWSCPWRPAPLPLTHGTLHLLSPPSTLFSHPHHFTYSLHAQDVPGPGRGIPRMKDMGLALQ